jgi:hypothetical protein
MVPVPLPRLPADSSTQGRSAHHAGHRHSVTPFEAVQGGRLPASEATDVEVPRATAHAAGGRCITTEALVAFVAGLAIAVVTTWPLAWHIDTAARDTVDVPYEAWLLDWSGHAVTSGDSLLDANLFHPESAASMGADPLWGLGIPLLPLHWLGLSALGVHNAAVLLAFAANAAAGYVAGRVIAGTRAAGAIVGAALAFGPFHTSEAGHIQILFHPALPLAAAVAWMLADRAEEDRPALPAALALGALVAWQLTISLYIALYTAITAVVVLTTRAVMARYVPTRRVVRGLAAGAVLPAAVAVAVGLAYRRRSEPLPPLDEALRRAGALSGDLVHTQPKLLAWGRLLGKGDGWFAITGAFPGLVIVMLGVVGIVAGWRAIDPHPRRVARLAAALAVAGVLLALGAAESGPRAYLPWRWVMTVVPPLRGLRAVNRGMLVALLGLGLGASILVSKERTRVCSLEAQRKGRGTRPGAEPTKQAQPHCLGEERAETKPYGSPAFTYPLTHLLTRTGRRAVAATAVVVMLVVGEGLASWAGLPRLGPRPIDRELGAIDEAGAVVYLPLPTGAEVTVADWSQAVIALRTTAHHRPTVNGYGGYFPPSYAEAKVALATFPGDAAKELLVARDVHFVVVDRAAVAGTPWESLAHPEAGLPVEWLTLVTEDGADLLYRVAP